MNEKINNWVIVAPEAPEWMRRIAKTLAEAGDDAHGAILAICGRAYTTVRGEAIDVMNVTAVIKSLADAVREQVGEKVGDVLLEMAIRGKEGKP